MPAPNGQGVLPASPPSNQNYLGAPLAVGEGKVFMSSDDSTTGRSDVFALGRTG